MLAPLAVAALFVAASCSDDDDDAGAAITEAPPETAAATAPATEGTGLVEITEPDRSTSVASDAVAATDATTTTIGTVPDEGVPGIDSEDAFCRSWSEFAGSFQALAIATSFGSDRGAAARLEVAASGAIVGSIDGLDEHLPDELESERDALVTGLAGPMFRRAERAGAELTAAGLSTEEVEALGESWLSTLAEVGLDEPDIAFTVPDDIDEPSFDAAAAVFGDELPPINQDPSLITDAQIPFTEQYLSANCPDQGTLGGNDMIDQV